MTVVQLTVAHPSLSDGAALFDAYRQHYGANPAPEAAEPWMRDQVLTDRMRLFAAVQDERVAGHLRGVGGAGLADPADRVAGARPLRRPGARRAGLGRPARHVADAARVEGAHRLSLQTEPTNARALELYAKAGFEPVNDLALLHRVLSRHVHRVGRLAAGDRVGERARRGSPRSANTSARAASNPASGGSSDQSANTPPARRCRVSRAQPGGGVEGRVGRGEHVPGAVVDVEQDRVEPAARAAGRSPPPRRPSRRSRPRPAGCGDRW